MSPEARRLKPEAFSLLPAACCLLPFFFLLPFLLFLTGCQDQPQQPGHPLRKTFVATAPVGWETREPFGPAAVGYVSPPSAADVPENPDRPAPASEVEDPFTEIIHITVSPIPPERQDDPSFLEPSPEAMKKTAPDFTIAASGSGQLDGRPARWIVYTFSREGQSIKGTSWVATNAANGYIITLHATPGTFERYQPEFQGVLDSFRFVVEQSSGATTTAASGGDSGGVNNE